MLEKDNGQYRHWPLRYLRQSLIADWLLSPTKIVVALFVFSKFAIELSNSDSPRRKFDISIKYHESKVVVLVDNHLSSFPSRAFCQHIFHSW